ncbi:MAG TPA: MFS transporter [Thermomicrobiales bacterium]|nr:MFS transporter [Thermomicrobiales bacterium]
MKATPETTIRDGQQPRPRIAVPRTFQSLVDYPMFRQLWLAMMATSISQWTAQVTFGWLALVLTDSARFVGIVSFMSGLPFLVIALPAGVYIDRLDRRKILLTAQSSAALLGIVMAIVVLAGWVQPWHLLVAAFLNGSFLSVLNPTMQSVIPGIVGKDGLTNSVGLMSAGQNMTRIVGPSMAGVTIGFSSTGFAFLLIAVTLLVAVLLISKVRVPDRAASVTAKGWQAAFSGLQIIWNRGDLRVLFVLACLPPLLIFPYIQFLNIFARDILEIGAQGLGVLTAASGVGAVIGSLMMASRTFRRGDGIRQIRIILLYALGVIGVAFSTTLWITLPLLVMGGMLGGTYMSTNNALLQLRIEDEVRGRVMATYMMTFGLLPLGALPMGLVADALGIQLAVALGSTSCTALILVIALHSKSLRKI